MAYCGKCIHLDVCKSAETCDGHVPRCKHFIDKNGMALASCKLGAKGCFTDGKCRYSKPCGNKVVTRADQLRAMSDEELCEFLGQCKCCDICEEGCDSCAYNGDCDKRLLEWLQEPIEEGAT